jgi:hypothetical protein
VFVRVLFGFVRFPEREKRSFLFGVRVRVFEIFSDLQLLPAMEHNNRNKVKGQRSKPKPHQSEHQQFSHGIAHDYPFLQRRFFGVPYTSVNLRTREGSY